MGTNSTQSTYAIRPESYDFPQPMRDNLSDTMGLGMVLLNMTQKVTPSVTKAIYRTVGYDPKAAAKEEAHQKLVKKIRKEQVDDLKKKVMSKLTTLEGEKDLPLRESKWGKRNPDRVKLIEEAFESTATDSELGFALLDKFIKLKGALLFVYTGPSTDEQQHPFAGYGNNFFTGKLKKVVHVMKFNGNLLENNRLTSRTILHELIHFRQALATVEEMVGGCSFEDERLLQLPNPRPHYNKELEKRTEACEKRFSKKDDSQVALWLKGVQEENPQEFQEQCRQTIDSILPDDTSPSDEIAEDTKVIRQKDLPKAWQGYLRKACTAGASGLATISNYMVDYYNSTMRQQPLKRTLTEKTSHLVHVIGGKYLQNVCPTLHEELLRYICPEKKI